MNRFHSVTLDREQCRGCINCLKRCPTGGIRVRGGKAQIIPDRCIDCGECIRVCPYHAKLPVYDPLSGIHKFACAVALPAPALYGQFDKLEDVDALVNAFLKIGFHRVFEVGRAAEIISDATRRLLAEGASPRPLISSACPAVTRIIRVRFPALVPNLLPLLSPDEYAARLARREAMAATGLPADQIGIFHIAPCPALVTAKEIPFGVGHSEIDGVLSIGELYPLLRPHVAEEGDAQSEVGRIGVSWAASEGEAAALLDDNYLAADGIENVIRVLEELESDRFPDLRFVELTACSGGCVGGVLCVENPYVAKARIKKLRKYLPVSRNRAGDEIPRELLFETALQPADTLRLSADLGEAMQMMRGIDDILAQLPGLDCGSCGAPSCAAFAEDVVRGHARLSDCVVRTLGSEKSTVRFK